MGLTPEQFEYEIGVPDSLTAQHGHCLFTQRDRPRMTVFMKAWAGRHRFGE